MRKLNAFLVSVLATVALNPTFLIIGKLEKVSDGTCGLSASFGNIAA